MGRQKVRQFKAYRGFNSYVATEPLQELQIDIADFTASGALNDGFRYAFVAIDIFTKFCHAVPIKDKKTDGISTADETNFKQNWYTENHVARL